MTREYFVVNCCYQVLRLMYWYCIRRYSLKLQQEVEDWQVATQTHELVTKISQGNQGKLNLPHWMK